MPINVVQHPLAHDIVSRLRDAATEPAAFRALCHKLTYILAIEATRDLPTARVVVRTPLEACTTERLAQDLCAIAILRAGLGMVSAVVELFTDVSVGYVGLERDEHTAAASRYYCKLPPLAGKRILLVDPMLATGGSACSALRLIAEHGGTEVSLLSIVAAPEGAAAVEAAFPEVQIYTTALDRELNAYKYIVPGLGDFGDRLYGT